MSWSDWAAGELDGIRSAGRWRHPRDLDARTATAGELDESSPRTAARSLQETSAGGQPASPGDSLVGTRVRYECVDHQVAVGGAEVSVSTAEPER